MNAQQYQAALTALSLTSRDVCAWLGVSRRGEALWRENGPSNLAGRMIEMQLRLRVVPTLHGADAYSEIGISEAMGCEPGLWFRYSDIAPLLAVGAPQDDAS